MRRTAGLCFLSLGLLLSISCAPPIAFRTPRYNIRVAPTTTPETPEDIDVVAEAVIRRLSDATGWTKGELEHAVWGIKLTIEEEPFECGFSAASGLCWGLANEFGVRYVYMPCIATTALAHELIHLLVGKCGTGWDDPAHETREWWGGGQTVEALARLDACHIACPDVCK